MIKHALYQEKVEEVFFIEVKSGAKQGTYSILKPDGFDEIISLVDVGDEFFNVKNVILGESQQISILENQDKKTFDILEFVNEEQGIDAIVTFKYKVKNKNEEIDVLLDRYEINFNKFKIGYEKEKKVISTEIRISESASRMANRDDTSVNLFSEKSLDDNTIAKTNYTNIVYKHGNKLLQNFYFYKPDQREDIFSFRSSSSGYKGNPNEFFHQYLYSDRQFGYDLSYRGSYGSYHDYDNGFPHGDYVYQFRRVLFQADISYDLVKLEISNLDVIIKQSNSATPFKLIARIRSGYNNTSRDIILENSSTEDINGITYEVMAIQNKIYELGFIDKDDIVDVFYKLDNGVTMDKNSDCIARNTETSLKIKTYIGTPSRKSRVLRLKDALQSISDRYSDGYVTVKSNSLSNGGQWYNTGVTTGLFLRGVANIFLGEEKIMASMDSVFNKGAYRLLGLGCDLQDKSLIVESIDYFFKDVVSYDLSHKEFEHESLDIKNNSNISFNKLLFGTKKFSTNKDGDLLNFNTKLEATTPLKTVKKTFDKQSDAIIDEDEISSLIDDKSSSTNDKDDEIVIVDLVKKDIYTDVGILYDCEHDIDSNGKLLLKCYNPPFDVIPLQLGMDFTILAGFNVGTYKILGIDKYKLTLDKNIDIVEGKINTRISFVVKDIIKNRTFDGFSDIENVRDKETSVNLRHNPKFQLARWFGFYGGGFDKKLSTENIIINSYKNNGKVKLKANDISLNNEIQNLVQLNENISLADLRNYKQPYFSSQEIEVTILNVMFYEFIDLLNKWRYETDTWKNNRGYIKLNLDGVEYKVYPMGDKALEHDKKYNELTIRGYIK